MEKDLGLCDLVFDYYESQILFGCRKYGDRLPSIAKICDAYHLGRNTVRGAFDRLKEKGYIHARERRGYTVAYQGTLEDFEKNKAEYFAAREAGIRDLIRTAEVLLAPFLEVVPEQAGLRGETARRALNGAPFAAGALFRPPFENGLFTNLCWECLRYLRFLSFQQTKERPASGAAALRQALWADKAARGVGREELPRFITRTCEKYQLEKTEQIPFRWTVYRRRPQLRYTLAANIIREILRGQYLPGTFLPSLPEMAERYEVSLATARRTVAVLNALGVARSCHGSGSKICMDPAPLDASSPDIQESMRLHRESLQIMVLTIRSSLLLTLGFAGKEQREQLAQRLLEILSGGERILCFDAVISFICRECPSAMIRECYERLREFTVWGYVPALPRLKSDAYNDEYIVPLQEMIRHLRQEELTAFADDWQAMMTDKVQKQMDVDGVGGESPPDT